ncbi:DapH/DapD/GlmU-related protein [Carboxylicivirga marina]|uniref:DapH/DapD/GlmU-related protein n=1 Tax=Carboxylicivirga marina TaxID=2800988 RepID=UPI0025990226|nr:DapH/DapD/GlmU-related protein [uncultured Carboxylicivirga sp.]
MAYTTKDTLKKYYIKIIRRLKIHKSSFYYGKIIEKVLVIVDIPESSQKRTHWHDGFTAAIDLLDGIFQIEFINLRENESPCFKYINSFDLVMFKANWNWGPDLFYQRNRSKFKTICTLLISGSTPPPSIKHLFSYDILFYETHFYKKFVSHHPFAFHAFGIDNSIMKHDSSAIKDIDVLSIGQVKRYKRFEKLKECKGRRVIVGELSNCDEEYINDLKSAGIEIFDFISYEALSTLYNRAKLVYLPCSSNGGGERAVLEARSCECEIKVEEDNEKLKGLVTEPIWNHSYYAQQIIHGINFFTKKGINERQIFSKRNILIGLDSFHNGNFRIAGDENVSIGNYCSFGKNVSIITSNHDYSFPVMQGSFYKKFLNINHPGETKKPANPQRSKGSVTIGHDVWVGDNTIILSGVKIGDGCIIGANSVVTKDIEDYTIHAGNPAKLIKKRYKEDDIFKIKKTKWWFWNKERILKNKNFFLKDNLNTY